MKDPRDEQLYQQVREQLQNRADQLDVATQTRLATARRAALAMLERRRGRQWHWFAGAAVAATVVLAVTLMWQLPGDPENLYAEDFEMLVTGEGLELYEDLEFYEWLASANGSV